MTCKQRSSKSRKYYQTLLFSLGLAGTTSACAPVVAQISQPNPKINTPSPTITPTASPTQPPPTATPTATASPTLTPSPTLWPSPTPLPTATPWAQPKAWTPDALVIPTLAPVPVVPQSTVTLTGAIPAGYSPPDGVDVFGNTILRWNYWGNLAEDEWFDIKIKPLGSENSAFVDWTKSAEYELKPWHGWTPGLYTWQIGIVKGYKEGETKNFIADTGRDSEKFIIKWQALGGSSGGGGGGQSGGGSSSGGS